MKRSKDELIAQVQAYIGEDTSDEAITLLEDVSDSVSDVNEDVEELTKQLNEANEKVINLDNEWRERYKARFNDSSLVTPQPEEQEDIEDEGEGNLTEYEELFD